MFLRNVKTDVGCLRFAIEIGSFGIGSNKKKIFIGLSLFSGMTKSSGLDADRV